MDPVTLLENVKACFCSKVVSSGLVSRSGLGPGPAFLVEELAWWKSLGARAYIIIYNVLPEEMYEQSMIMCLNAIML